MDATKFFEILFGNAVSKDARLVIWTLPDKRTAFFDTVNGAASYAESRASDSDVYFGLGLVGAVASGRGCAKDVRYITCLWADVDFGTGHKKGGIPPHEDAAQSILDRIGIKPSIVVHSGHGLHAYWLLDEPMGQEDGAALLTRRWSNTVGACAHVLGFAVDRVHDLSRVLRVPGTFNRKEDPLPVVVVKANNLRYSYNDIDIWCVDEEYTGATTDVKPVELDHAAEPPAMKLAAMIENSLMFKRTWQRNRIDKKAWSASEYDLSLATQAVIAGWTDQEIANLILAFRQEHNLDVKKAYRRDYLIKTITRAKVFRLGKAALSDIGDINTRKSVTESDKATLLAAISEALGIEVAQWIQYGEENAQFSLILKNGTDIALGTVDNVLSQMKFRARVYEVGIIIPRMKGGQWDEVCQGLAKIREVVEIGESGRVQRLAEWLSSYTNRVTVFEGDDWGQGLMDNQPFRKDGCLCIHVMNLRSHIRTRIDEIVSAEDVKTCLRAAGYMPKSYSKRDSRGKVVSRHYWFVAENKEEEADNDE